MIPYSKIGLLAKKGFFHEARLKGKTWNVCALGRNELKVKPTDSETKA